VGTGQHLFVQNLGFLIFPLAHLLVNEESSNDDDDDDQSQESSDDSSNDAALAVFAAQIAGPSVPLTLSEQQNIKEMMKFSYLINSNSMTSAAA